MLHIHDYEMMFVDDTNKSLRYALHCSCGDVAPDLLTAQRRTERSFLFFILSVLVIFAALFGFVWVTLVALAVLA